MTARQQLLLAITELEGTLERSVALGYENFRDNRKQAVKLRLPIADRLAMISSLGDLAFEGTEKHDAFRSEFSKMRSTMAAPHSSWPVIANDLEDPAYLKSASNRAFIAWVKQALLSG